MDQACLEKVLQSPRLPSLPIIALEVIQLVQKKDVNLKQIASTIQHDPALTSKILRTVNSSFYGQAFSIGTISQALVVLGMNSVKTLALGFSLIGNLTQSGGPGFDHVTFWKRSLYSATAARMLCERVGGAEVEEAFLCGLLQDLGILALAQVFGETYHPLVAEAAGDGNRLCELERATLGTDHATLGGQLAEIWNLPPQMAAAIRAHHRAEAVEDGAYLLLVRCCEMGDAVASIYTRDDPGQPMGWFQSRLTGWFDIPECEADELLCAIHAETKNMRRLFDLPTGELENADEILARANEAMLQISMQMQRETTVLQRQNQELISKANTDPLTGIANRGGFDLFARNEFEKSQQSLRPLSLLFVDTDHFKQINDTFGHSTGDRALVALAAALCQDLPTTALAARYGGEEFTLVYPGLNLQNAAVAAEQLRRKIASIQLQADDGRSLVMTASIGVASFEPGRAENTFDDVRQWIHAADLAVYAAKRAGRNCVRVFRPRPQRRAVAG